MKERYAFRYNEFLQQQKQENKVFVSNGNTDALTEDIKARFCGADFFNGTSPFLKLGIQAEGSIALHENWQELTDVYGADALRIALIEQMPLTDENLTGCWRFVGNLWRFLKTYDLKENFSDWQIYEWIKKNDYQQVLIALKSAIKQERVGKDVFKLCYPFMPHLILSFCPDVHVQMISFWKNIQEISLPKKMFIQVNGKRVSDFYPKTEQKEEIIEEVLCFDKIKRKIGDKSIKQIVFIPEKGVNVVV